MPAQSRHPTEAEEALREECLSHVDALYGTALRMTRNRQDAEDLVQDTYVKAVKNLHRFQQGASCKAWLFRILTNTYIDRYRRTRRSPTPVEFDDTGVTGLYDQATEDVDPPVAPELQDEASLGDFLRKFVVDEVKAAIDDLPEIFREVIVLRDVEGFSYQECADLLEIPIGTVMSRLYRGRRLLQEALWSYAREHGYLPDEGPGS